MSKISTRKGLAFGALIALGSSVIAGAPANAADLSLAPSLGTTYSVLLGDTFTLNSAVTGNTNIANTSAWKWEVVNTSGVTVGVAGTYWDETANTNVGAYATSSLATASTGTTKVYTPGATKVTDVIGKVNTITLDPTSTSTTATFSVTVRSFSDLDASGSVTAGDLVSDAKTVTFVNGAEVTGTIALDDVNAGVAPTGTLSLDKDINVEQTTLPTAVFTINGTAGTGVTAALNTAKTGFTLTHGSTAAAGNIVSVKASWLRYDSDSTKKSATSATKTALAASDADTAAVTLANSDDIATGAGTYAAGADANVNKIVRAGVKTVTFTTAFTKTGVAVAAGQPVTVIVAEADASTDLAAGTVITAGGKELKDTGAGTTDSVTYYTTTNADGKVVVTIASDDATAADHILVTVTANTGTAEVAILWATAVAHTLQELNTPLLTTTRVIKAGSSVAVSYRLQDQFGKAFTKTDYNYRVVLSASGITINSPIVTLTNGVGTATVLENDPAAAGFTLLASAQVQTGTGAWGALSDATPAAITRSSVVTVADAVAVPASITLSTAVLGDASAIASTGVVLADKDLTALDLRFNSNSGSALGLTNTTAAKLVGTVKQADGSVASGVSVTISAPNVAFSVDATGSSVVSLGSITVNTTTGGEYTVYAFSKKSGAITVTHTAAGVSKTQAITWAKAAASSATTVSVEAATVAKSGRTLPVSVKLVDKFGNAVDTAAADGLLTITVDGPGYTTTVADNTDSNGLVKFNVILGSADAGAITVTASYDSNGATADVAGTTVLASATKTILVGISASITKAATSKVTVKNASGLTVKVVRGSKSTTKVATSDSYKLSLKGGTGTVKVYVNGVLVTSKK